MKLFSTLASAAALLSTAHAVHPVDVRGQNFVDTVTGRRLMLLGVEYVESGGWCDT